MVNMEYTIKTDEKTLRLLITILDFYSRVGIGQFKNIIEHPTFYNILEEKFTPKGTPKIGDSTPYGEVVKINKNTFKTKSNWGKGEEIREFPINKLIHSVDWDEFHNNNYILEVQLAGIRNQMINEKDLSVHGSLGIHHPEVDDTCRQSYDILQIIRHELWKNNPNRSQITVDSSISLSADNKINFKII